MASSRGRRLSVSRRRGGCARAAPSPPAAGCCPLEQRWPRPPHWGSFSWPCQTGPSRTGQRPGLLASDSPRNEAAKNVVKNFFVVLTSVSDGVRNRYDGGGHHVGLILMVNVLESSNGRHAALLVLVVIMVLFDMLVTPVILGIISISLNSQVLT